MNTNTPTVVSITKDERGQAMLEFTGSIILFVLLYLFLITIGLRIADYSAVQKVARDAGREATITGNMNDGYYKAQETAWMWHLDPNKLSVYLSTSQAGQRNLVTSEVNYRSSPFARMFPTLVGQEPVDEKELTGQATFGWWDFEN